MKELVFLLSLMVSFTTFSCPNLSGNYICTTPEIPGGDPYVVTVAHNEKSYSETMSLEDGTTSVDEYIVDGKRQYGSFGIQYIATCNSELEIYFSMLWVKSWIRYVETEDGFVVYKRQSKTGEEKLVKVYTTVQ